MEVRISAVNSEEYRMTENITRESFWNVYKPGCDEHLVLNKLRKSSIYVPQLDLIACCDGVGAGHIICTKAYIEQDCGKLQEVLCAGPLSVLPEYRDRGVGGLLLKTAASKAADIGYKGIILFGDPAYYSRFGYINAGTFGIWFTKGENPDYFMALELSSDSLKGTGGRFIIDKAFESTAAEIEEFENEFPYKVKSEKPMRPIAGNI